MLSICRQYLYQWFTFPALIIACALTLQCCGSGLTQSKTSPVEIILMLPQGEDPSLFWFGVQRKLLRWKPEEGGAEEIAWESGATAGWNLKDGDRIEFQGLDSSGRVLVIGEASVSEEKKVTLPLRRVL